MKQLILTITLLIFANVTFSQINLSKSRIIADTSIAADREAAKLMSRYIKEISGANVAIFPKKTKIKGGDIVIGVANEFSDSKITTDGFSIKTNDGNLRVLSGDGYGALYGVCEVLEKYFGVKHWAPNAIDVPKRTDMTIAGNIDYLTNPAFEYRQTNGYGQDDAEYKMFHRLKLPKEVFAENMWVHTFNTLVPAAIYGKSNPEYFAFIKGERRPGTQSQLCLTNDDVFELIVHKLDSIFKIDPTKKMISVSQNDGNMTNCSCDKCKELDNKEEALSGSIIHFINRLADRFPDKEISTLAYTYSVKPPKYVTPRKNVNIMLCDIDCMRELPLTETTSGKDFVKDLEGWSKISNNIYVWDYGINFDNTVSPFPNFHVLQPNIQLFHKNNVTKLFEQVNGYKGVDFAELRGYMIAKLMWDPYCDVDAVMKEFLWGYYKDAAPFIYDYLKLQQGGLVSTATPLWIYDSPVTHKNGFLNAQMIKEYKRLFDRAEQSVKDDAVVLDRVKLSRLPLQYAELEIARTLSGQDAVSLRKQVEQFRESTKYFNIKTLNERSNDPETYCTNYLERYLPANIKNKAEGAVIEWGVVPSGRYSKGAEKILTDGLYGGTSFVESWVGWEGVDGEFVIDLGEVKEFSTIESDFLHQLGQWVFLPKSVTYKTSVDGKEFVDFGTCEKPEIRESSVLFDKFKVEKKGTNGRFIRVKIENIKTCPAWHYGIGHNAWMFMDEITVL